MKLIRILAITTIAGSLAVSTAFAGFSQGGSFTGPGYGARAWGMGGAAIAVGSDEGATFWNPALLSLLECGRLGFTYIDLVPGADAQQSYLAYARGLKDGSVDDPELDYSKHSFGVLYGNLSLELSDGQRYSENTLLLGYAYSPDYFWSVGASLGLLLSTGDLGQFEAKGTTFSVGLRVELLESVTFGAVGRNLASQLMFDSGENYGLQRSLSLGFAYRLWEMLTLETDLVGAYGSVARFVLGGEGTFFSDILKLRAGISAVTTGENRSIPHLGVGVKLSRIHIDYNANFDTTEAFDRTHRFSLAIEL